MAAGLAATAEIMQRNATMAYLAAQRGALVEAAAAPQYQLTLQALQARLRQFCFAVLLSCCPTQSSLPECSVPAFTRSVISPAFALILDSPVPQFVAPPCTTADREQSRP